MSDAQSQPDAPQKGFFAWFAENTVAANLLMAFLLIGGWIVATNTNASVMPSIDQRAVSVSVSYPGATPEEVELSITRRVEEAVLGIEGVDRVRSTASEGSGSVTIEVDDFADKEAVKDDVQTAVDQISNFPPEDAEQAKVTISSRSSRVMRLVITGDLGERALRQAAEAVERDLISGDGVSSVTLQGARDYEIAIEISEANLRKYGLSISQVASAIRASSVTLSGGVLRTPSGEILLRTDEEARTAEAFEDFVIASDESGQRILLKDIATVVDGFEDVDLVNTYNGRDAVFLQIDKSEEEDAFAVAEAVKSFLSTYTPPAGVNILVASDNTEVIVDRISLLMRNAILGLALVFVFLSLTLDLRLAFWTSLGIPISFLGGFMLFGQVLTINMITLFGLIMVLGLVVDDAIVVGENIYEEQLGGKTGSASAIAGAKGVMAPVFVGILTTMAAFAPLLYSSGMLGQIMGPVPVVVICVLAISLVEAFLILPAHLSHGGEWTVGPMKRIKLVVQGGLMFLRDQIIIPAVQRAMQMRYVTIAVCLGILIVFAGVFGGGYVRFIFFPQVEDEEVTVNLTMPEGTPFEETEKIMKRIEAAAYEAVGGEGSDLYRSFVVTIGASLSSGFGGGRGTQTGSHKGAAEIELVPSKSRDVSTAEVERKWRQLVGPVAGAEKLTFSSSSFGGGADVSYDLSHVDNKILLDSVDRLMVALETIDGVAEIESGADRGKRQLNFFLTPMGDAAGLTVQDLARQVRQAFFGEEVQRIQRGREEVRVYIRLPENERQTLEDLSRLRIRLPSGGEAPLSTVAEVTESRSASSINRVDGRRIISVTADVDEAVATPNEINDYIQNEILPAILKDYPQLRYTAEGQAREQRDDLSSLMRNLSIASLLMFVLLASVLRSYVQPLVILAAIPFGAVGAILGHLLMGYNLSFLSLFGVVALSGVVVNDSVVLIDLYNKLRAAGGSVFDSALAATRRRFRPILLTTLTTFIGLAPMLVETSPQAQFLIPMAISVGFGIMFASVLILFLVPCLLLVVDDLAYLARNNPVARLFRPAAPAH